jgi:murein DD-endopeptidase MepM/ murein hydrolase activator NlpD
VRRRFEPPAQTWSPGHRGVDLAGAVGQTVLSAGAGTVSFSGVVAGRGVVTVRHAGGLRTTYEPLDDRPAAGATTARGGRIGSLAATPGHCAPAACLHWGAVSGDTYRDPLSLLDPGHPVLLPLR